MRLELLKAHERGAPRAARRRCSSPRSPAASSGSSKPTRSAAIRSPRRSRRALRAGKSGTGRARRARAISSPSRCPPVRLVMIGAVHISQALAPIARIAGLDVTIIDPRTAFATPERFPDAPVLAEWPDEALDRAPLDRYTAIALLTHDPKIDDRALTRALRAECFYIGALGSRKTHAKRLERMRGAGLRRGARWRASTRRSASTSARSARPKSPSRSSARSSPPCARSRCAQRDTRLEIRFGSRRARRSARSSRMRCAATARAEEGPGRHAEHQAALTAAGVERDHRGAARARRRRRGRSGAAPRRAPRRRESARSSAPSPAASICSPTRPAWSSSTPRRSTRVNGVDEAITVATLAPFRAVAAGDMVATVKIIPFAVPGAALDAALARRSTARPCVAAFRPLRVGVVSTLLPGLKPSVVAKTLRVLEERLAPAGARIVREERVAARSRRSRRGARPRSAPDCDVLLIFGASAITDRRDVIPAAIEAIGGRVEHFGMPVDPGNLLLLGAHRRHRRSSARRAARARPRRTASTGCCSACSPACRSAAPTSRRMGVGGLLMEIASRPQPRLGDG